MKIVFAFIAFCFFAIAAKAQLNTDTVRAVKTKHSLYDSKPSKAHDHLHPKIQNLANPSDKGYEMDGAVIRHEAIVIRHVTNLYDLVK